MQQPDVVLFYNDFGRPYLPLIERLVQSAKVQMPECRTVVMTMTPSKKLFKLFDHPIHIVSEPNAKTVCLDKARAIVTYMAQADRPVIFTDPDVEFVRPAVFPEADVGLLWRKSKPSQPVNSGMIFSLPSTDEFWKRYGNTVAGLPSVLHAWWADQLALSVMIGTYNHKAGDTFECHGAQVSLLEENDVCAAPERATEKAFAIHYKGWRKGEGWEQYFPRKSAA